MSRDRTRTPTAGVKTSTARDFDPECTPVEDIVDEVHRRVTRVSDLANSEWGQSLLARMDKLEADNRELREAEAKRAAHDAEVAAGRKRRRTQLVAWAGGAATVVVTVVGFAVNALRDHSEAVGVARKTDEQRLEVWAQVKDNDIRIRDQTARIAVVEVTIRAVEARLADLTAQVGAIYPYLRTGRPLPGPRNRGD